LRKDLSVKKKSGGKRLASETIRQTEKAGE